MPKRCAWVTMDPDYIAYHDNEWGVPEHDDQRLFEFLILEGAQAGLSWLTILKKRANYRRAMDAFDPARVARYDENRIAQLMQNPGFVRNRLKLQAAVPMPEPFAKSRRPAVPSTVICGNLSMGGPARTNGAPSKTSPRPHRFPRP